MFVYVATIGYPSRPNPEVFAAKSKTVLGHHVRKAAEKGATAVKVTVQKSNPKFRIPVEDIVDDINSSGVVQSKWVTPARVIAEFSADSGCRLPTDICNQIQNARSTEP